MYIIPASSCVLCLTMSHPSIIRVVASVMLTDWIQQICIPLQAVLMIMLKAKLVKICSTIPHPCTGYPNLVPLRMASLKYANTWSTLRSQTACMLSEPSSVCTCLDIWWFTSRNMGCSVSVCLEISIDLSSRVAKTAGNYLQIKVFIAQKLPGFCIFCSIFCRLSGDI